MNRYLLSIILIFFFTDPGSAQNSGLDQLVHDFEQYKDQLIREKIYVHTDRSFYLAGETVWFKVYAVEGEGHKPLTLSKVVYLEILDKENKAVAQAKIAMKEGSGNGSFYLPLRLETGNYKLRAYTHWMNNFSPGFYFEKQLSISNTFLDTDFGTVENSTAFNLQFFPEGGELVEGIRSKVAFKIVDNQGKGLDARGVVVKPNGDTVALLNPLKFGMGHFYLEPESDISYKAMIRAGSDSIHSFTLPATREKGYVMALKDSGEGELEVAVHSNLQDQTLYLLVHTRQNIKVAEARTTVGGKAIFKFAKHQLGEGISHLTLFNAEKQAVAERLYFKYPGNPLRIKVETDARKYAPRQKVSVKLQAVSDEDQAGVNLSMAVYRLDSLNAQSQENIMSYLWLSSDLKGYIQNSSYYFENVNTETAKAMDHLMLTQGWRRFRWEDVLKKEKAAISFLPEYEGHLIQAVVTDNASGAPVKGVSTYLSSPGRQVQFYGAGSNEHGEVRFVTKDLYGKKNILLRSNSVKEDIGIKIQNPFSEKFSDIPVAPFVLPESKAEQLRLHHINMQVQNTYWQDERNKLIAAEQDSVAFFGVPDKVYRLDDFTRFPTMEEVMREYVYEVRVRKENGKFVFKVFNPALDNFYQTGPLVLLDGIPVTDIDKLMAYSPLKVEKLEVVTEKFFIGKALIFNGIVSYTTYKGEMEGFPLDPEFVKVDFEGLQLQREFYSPQYETGHEHSSRRPDFRTLLFWAPEIKPDDIGQTELNFYTSDLEGTFLLEVQGIGKGGKAGVETLTIEVGEGNL